MFLGPCVGLCGLFPAVLGDFLDVGASNRLGHVSGFCFFTLFPDVSSRSPMPKPTSLSLSRPKRAALLQKENKNPSEEF